MKKVKFISIVVCLMAVLFVVNSANAELYNRGTDSLGNRLIYDSDLDITWYDFSYTSTDWDNAMDWVGSFSVTFGENTYTDWRLPTTVDGSYSDGFDGTTTAGYNITSSEMGHLYYAELGNEGLYDIFGNNTGCISSSLQCLQNTAYFENLQASYYWSETDYSSYTAYSWLFGFHVGIQEMSDKSNNWYAMAVRAGDVPQQPVVPEPISSILFLTGGGVLAGRRFWKQRRNA